MVLNTYVQKTQRLLHDISAQFWSVADLTTYINEGRGQIALEGQCIRVLTPTSGPVASVTVLNGGTGYSAPPSVSIIGLGSGATAHATVAGNAVTGVIVDTPGAGYFPQSTNVTFGGPGTGATATAVISNVLQTVTGQENYTFAAANPLVAIPPSGLQGGSKGGGAGVSAIIAVDSVSISWGQGMKPTVFRFVWSDFQAYLRAYSIGLQGYPAYASQYGQGGTGSIDLWPIPSGAYQMEWDCICIPIDLNADTDPEFIPYPWTVAIPYYAAYVAFLNARQKDQADGMLQRYQWYMRRAGAYSRIGVVPDYYISS